MKCSKSRLVLTALGLALLGALNIAPAADKEDPRYKQRNPAVRPSAPAPQPPSRGSDPSRIPGRTPEPVQPPVHAPDLLKPPAQTPDSLKPPIHTPEPVTPAVRSPEPAKPPIHPQLTEQKKPNGEIERRSSSGTVREVTKVDPKTGNQQTQYHTPTGRIEKQVVAKPGGAIQTTHYDPSGRVKREEIVSKDGKVTQTIDHQPGVGGNPRALETVQYNNTGQPVSKTVVVKQTTVLTKNTTIINNNTTIINNNNTRIVNNTEIVRNYDRGHYGYVYRPVYVVNSPVFVSWYDPYWYTPGGVVIFHPFHYSWGWDDYGWYRCNRYYWNTYEVYPAPSYWVTDWLIAGYVADRYAVSMDAEQAREDARIAREEAARAMELAQRANDRAEIAEAQRAREDAEARAAKAEARAARVEAAQAKGLAGQPNANATPIDEKTKEALRVQVEQTIAEEKANAEKAAKGGAPIVPDLRHALEDPKHIYPVSGSASVTTPEFKPAGTLTEGDLLRLEPGQEEVLKTSNENTPLTMRVISSKGEEGGVPAGTLISVPLKSLQDFDSEFRAKLDLGLAEADKNKDQFKKAAKK